MAERRDLLRCALEQLLRLVSHGIYFLSGVCSLLQDTTDLCGAIDARLLVHGDSGLCHLRPWKSADSQTTDGSSCRHRCHRKTVAYSRYSRWLPPHVTSAHDTPRLAGMAQIERIADPAMRALRKKFLTPYDDRTGTRKLNKTIAT